MIEVDEALFDRMAGDTVLTAMLADYAGGPAIAAVSPLPDGMVPPYIVILPAIGDVPFDTKNTLGRTWTQDIACYTAADGSGLVDQIAQRIRGLGDGAYGFHRHRLAISGFSTIVSECGSVIQAPTDKTMYGRMVTLTLTAMQA